MRNIILCSSNPILIKSLYAILRDEGYNVDTVDRPALAVQKVLFGLYDVLIVDSEPFGLSAEDAVRIIRTVAPGMPIVPALVDAHLHGAGGRAAMESTAEALSAMAQTVARQGTTSLAATTVTAGIDLTCRAVEAMASYIQVQR